jgi:excisionase family DNA binding protein
MMTPMPLQPEAFDDPTLPRRFYNLKQVAAMLATTQAQVLALVRAGDLPAIKIGGRGQWRVEGSVLDRWIEQQYEKTRVFVAENPVEEGLEAAQDEA